MKPDSQPDSHKTAGSAGYQSDSVGWQRIAVTAAGLVTALLLVAFIASGAFYLLRPAAFTPPSAPAPPANIAGPRLQSAPLPDLQALRQEKSAMLNQYRWIDRDHGVVQIPIEHAMQLMVERNAASRGAAARPAK
jgi:hypothetical protein